MTADRIALKRCSKCGEVRLLNAFTKARRSKDGLNCQCVFCSRAASAAYRAANLEKARASLVAWVAKNPEKSKASSAAWRAANPERYRANQRVLLKKYTTELSDSYVTRILATGTPLSWKDIPPELVKLKRAQLLVARLLKKEKST